MVRTSGFRSQQHLPQGKVTNTSRCNNTYFASSSFGLHLAIQIWGVRLGFFPSASLHILAKMSLGLCVACGDCVCQELLGFCVARDCLCQD
eukprot:5094521-Amphidinium_carterae.2